MMDHGSWLWIDFMEKRKKSTTLLIYFPWIIQRIDLGINFKSPTVCDLPLLLSLVLTRLLVVVSDHEY